MKRNAKCPPPTGVDELPKTAQRAGTAEPADYRPAPRLVSRIATEPLYRSTIEIIEARKHAPLIPLTPSSSCHHHHIHRRPHRLIRQITHPSRRHPPERADDAASSSLSNG